MKTTNRIRRNLKNIFFIPRLKNKPKVFCPSIQRTGTTSVGIFLEEHGYRVAHEADGDRNNWNYYWYIGNYNKIFNSVAFNSFQAYEDSPWWYPDFYRVIYQHFPESKFILLQRDADAWFDSMMRLKQGRILGNSRRHSKIYRRMPEFFEKLDNDPDFTPSLNEKDQLLRLDGKRQHYTHLYRIYNREIKDYFRQLNPKALFAGRLEDPDKWQKIGRFLGLNVNSAYDVHANKSNERE